MDKVTIKSNYTPRELQTWEDLPTYQRHWFDYIKDDERLTPRLVHYKGCWYDVQDMEGRPPAVLNPKAYWHIYMSDSFFSGILVRFAGDQVVMGTYYS